MGSEATGNKMRKRVFKRMIEEDVDAIMTKEQRHVNFDEEIDECAKQRRIWGREIEVSDDSDDDSEQVTKKGIPRKSEVLNRPGRVWQEVSEYHLVKGRVSFLKANADLELLNSKTLVGALMQNLKNKCAGEMISLKVLAKKVERETFDLLAENSRWKLSYDEVMNFFMAELG
eukprot:g68599.t1